MATDLPYASYFPQPDPNLPPFAGPPWAYRRRGPRLLPLALFILFAALLLPGGGGWVLFGFLNVLLLLFLLVALVGVFAAFRFRRRVRRAFRDQGVPLEWHSWGPWRDGRDGRDQ